MDCYDTRAYVVGPNVSQRTATKALTVRHLHEMDIHFHEATENTNTNDRIKIKAVKDQVMDILKCFIFYLFFSP